MIFSSKKKAAFVLFAMTLLSSYSIKNIRLSRAAPSAKEYYTVEFEWFGMDAQRMEKEVAIPFEEKAAKLPRLLAASSVCERSNCVTSLVFEKGKRPALSLVSDAADEIKRSLPNDVQNPRIYAAAQDSKFVFCAAFDKGAFSYEEIKSRLLQELKGINGVSQARLSGGEGREIHIAFDDKALDKRCVLPWDLAKTLRESQAGFLGGNNVHYEEKIESLEAMEKALGPLKLGLVSEGLQRKESVVRVNGKESLVLSLKSSDESKNMAISKKARKIMKERLGGKSGWTIVYDNGLEQENSLKRIAAAFFETLGALTFAVWLFFRSKRATFLALAFCAADSLFTAAVFSALNIPLDSATISGLTISLGLMCDAALYVLDDCQTSPKALIACALTTAASILPLAALETLVPGVKSMSIACAVSIGLSCVLALVFLPAFTNTAKRRNAARNSLNLYDFSDGRLRKFLNLSKILYFLPFVLFVLLPKNLQPMDLDASIYAQAEFNPEKRMDLVDKEIGGLVKKLTEQKGVKHVKSEAKRGRAEIQIILKSPSDKKRVLAFLQGEKSVGSGFLYAPIVPSKRNLAQKMQIAVLGEDSGLCKKIAKEAARALQEQNGALFENSQVILNFKEDEDVFVARPKKDLLRKRSASASDASYFLRWNLFGPVALKVWALGLQTDARLGNGRLAFENGASIEDVKKLCLKEAPLYSLFDFSKEKRPERIFRKDSKRAAFFTVETRTGNSGKAFKSVKAALKKIELPDGYYFSWPKEYVSMPESYAKIFAAFLVGAAAIFFLVAAQSERIFEALLVLANVPISLSLPLLLRCVSLSPLTLGDAVGMAFISGLSVNNALYILAERKAGEKRGAFLAARRLSKSVLSSCATTLVASVPVMLSGLSFAADAAFFMFFGSAASVFSGLIYFPYALEKAGKKGPPKDGQPYKSIG